MIYFVKIESSHNSHIFGRSTWLEVLWSLLCVFMYYSRQISRPMLEEWHGMVFDRYKQPVCNGVRLADQWLLTHATCWLNRTITAMDILDGKILVKTGGERNHKTQFNFRVETVFFYPKMAVSARSEYAALAMVKVKALRSRSSSQHYPCVVNPRSRTSRRSTYFMTAKVAGVKPPTRVKLRTLTLRGHRQGACDGLRYICTKSFVRRLPPSKYVTESAPLYSREELALVGIRSMRQSPHLQSFIGVSNLVPWIDHTIATHS